MAPNTFNERELDAAIKELVNKKKLLKRGFSKEQETELKRLRNIQGSRAFRQRVKQSKRNFRQKDVKEEIYKADLEHYSKTKAYFKAILKEFEERYEM